MTLHIQMVERRNHLKDRAVKRAVASDMQIPLFYPQFLFSNVKSSSRKGKPQAIQEALTIKITLLSVERVANFSRSPKNLRRNEEGKKLMQITTN